ncbi:MAG: ABC transporter ATP-binding protein, partial [Pseudomonadota bacterium]
IQPMFDRVFVAGQRDSVFWVAFAVSGVFIIRAVSGFGHRVLMEIVGQRVSATMQRDLVRHLLALDSAFFQANPPGKLIERVRGDTLVAAQIWAQVFGAAGRDVVSLLSLLAVAISVDWLWTLIAIAGAPILMVPILMLQRFVRGKTRAAREAAAGLSTRLDEIFHGIDTIKLGRSETAQNARFTGAMGGYVSSEIRSRTGQAGIPALIDIVAAIGFFGVLAYGGFQIIDGEKTIGEFMSFFTAMALIFEPLRRIGNVTGAWQAALASLERIFAVFEERPSILSPATPRPLPDDIATSDVVFDNVDFAYGTEPVLSGLSFTAKAGETTAIVGPSGAGKSTVFRLLTRLADPVGGTVQLDGADVTEFALDDLRAQFAVVTQDAQIFDETLRDNLIEGAMAPSEDAVHAALEAAHVTPFVTTMPQGLDTRAGPRGSALSGGQRQRLAIARALLKDAPILLLDEATSALDAQSETLVQDALAKLSQTRTTLVIAHRLATVRSADRIVVMDKGRVVDEGSHDDLIARGGIYAELYRLQFSD